MKNLRRLMVAAVVSFIFPAMGLAQTGNPPGDSPADLNSMDLQQLMDVEVTTASLFSDKLSNAPGIMSVVTSDELQRFGGLTLGEILQQVPGLTGSTVYIGDRSLISARGDQTRNDGGHILILINGRPTREVLEGGIISDLMESFPVGILDRIEVIKGPGSVLYGSNAFSAVVNLITRKPSGTRVTAEGLGGVGGAVSGSAQVSLERGDFSMVGAAQVHDAPDWSPLYIVPPAERNLPTLPPAPNVQHPNLIDRGSGAYAEANYKGLSLMAAFTEGQSSSIVYGTIGEARETRDFANLGYDRKLKQNWDTSLNLTYTRTTFSEVSFPSTLGDSNELIAEWTNLITLTPKDRFTVGALFRRNSGRESYIGSASPAVFTDGSTLAGAFYAQLDHQLTRDLKLIAGVQSNKIGSIKLNTAPRLGAIWSPSSWISLKALYGQAFRAPSLTENLLIRPGIAGDPNLQPEKVSTFDLGISFQGNRVQAGADYFHSRQTGIIALAPNGPLALKYVNLGQLTFNGVEVEGKYYFQKGFFAQASTLYQSNQNESGRKDVTPIPNIGFKAGASYACRRGLTVSVFDVSDGPISGYSAAVNPRQGWHNILNGQLQYDVSRYLSFGSENNVAIVVHANNLFDHAVWLPEWGTGSTDTIPAQQGRVVYAGLQISLGKHSTSKARWAPPTSPSTTPASH